MIREIHALRRAPGVERIYVPGETENEEHARRQRLGIPLPARVLEEFERLGQDLGVPFPSGARLAPA